MNKREAGRLGGKATFAKYGSAHMAAIGSKGFWATIASLSERYHIDPSIRHNTFRYLLQNLNATKPKDKQISLKGGK